MQGADHCHHLCSNVDRIQQIINVAARYGRKVAVTGRSMENSMRVATELGYTEIPQGILVDINHIKSLPREKIEMLEGNTAAYSVTEMHGT